MTAQRADKPPWRTSYLRRCSVVSDPSVQARKMLGLEPWGQILGTGCRALETWPYRFEATKKGHLLALF